MTPTEKQQAFYKELKALLLKYKAELYIENFWINWSYDNKIVVEFEYDETLVEEHGTGVIPQLVLERYEDGKSE